MRACGFAGHGSLHRVLAGAFILAVAGLVPAAAQFPPPPGQNQSASGQSSPFPPPPGQSQPAAAQSNSPFPPPPSQQQQQSSVNSPFPPAPAPGSFGGAAPPSQGSFGALQGGFGVRPGGSSGGPPQGGFGGGPAQGGFGGPGPMGGGPSEAQKVCLTFPSIREDVEKGAAGIRAASDRKATREEVCPLFKSFAAKEAKMVKFLETNQKVCGIPPNIIPQVKQNHAKTIQIRNAVCSAAPSAPSGPTLSDALGGPIIADDTNVRTGRGTFDTLTGNALQR
jgi:hypothetical protein